MEPGKRRPVVGVIGSGLEAHRSRSESLGAWLASQGFHLLTGGGGGVMAAVSQSFYETPGREGLVIGILPCLAGDPLGRPPEAYPNAWVEVSIATHLPVKEERPLSGEDPSSRNHINVLSSDLLIALPGGHGTASEVRLALRYRRPLIAFLDTRDAIPDLPAEIKVESRLERVEDFVRQQFARKQ